MAVLRSADPREIVQILCERYGAWCSADTPLMKKENGTLIEVTSLSEFTGHEHVIIRASSHRGEHALAVKQDVWCRQCITSEMQIVHMSFFVQPNIMPPVDTNIDAWKSSLHNTNPALIPQDVTVILRVFNREFVLQRQVQAFLSQRPPIRKCQIFVAGSEKMANSARAVIKRLRPYAGPTILELIDVEPNLKLYGSWQLVLQVDTTYVAMYDDDQVPGPNHIETLIAAAQQTSGIVSMTGRHLERVTDWEKPSVHLGGPSSWVEHCALDNVALRVDKLDRHWLMHSSLAQQIWREVPTTLQGGDDLWVSHILNKYAGAESYVICSQYTAAHVMLDEGGIGGSSSAEQLRVRHSMEQYLFSRGSHRNSLETGPCRGRQRFVVVDSTDKKSLDDYSNHAQEETPSSCPDIVVIAVPETFDADHFPASTALVGSRSLPSKEWLVHVVEGCSMNFNTWLSMAWPGLLWPARYMCIQAGSPTLYTDFAHLVKVHKPASIKYLFGSSALRTILQGSALQVANRLSDSVRKHEPYTNAEGRTYLSSMCMTRDAFDHIFSTTSPNVEQWCRGGANVVGANSQLQDCPRLIFNVSTGSIKLNGRASVA